MWRPCYIPAVKLPPRSLRARLGSSLHTSCTRFRGCSVHVGRCNQRVGCDHIHGRICPIRDCHDQDGEPASYVWHSGRCRRSGPSVGLRHCAVRLINLLDHRHPGQPESWRRPCLARLPAVAGAPEPPVSQLQTTRPLHAIERLKFFYSALHGTAIRHAAGWLDLTTSPSEPFGGSPRKQTYFRQYPRNPGAREEIDFSSVKWEEDV